ncbi:MAG: TraR/DksA C4-type zinc finger protein [Verrucomicrobia bacterium]|nr:TraR/DksA C4-type zinc finger protein [Verrucomicrobiota bacterium]
MITRKAHMSADAKEEQPAYSEHMGDAGTDQYDQDFAFSMVSADQQAIYEIDQALGRIHDGTYGICELTGKPIEPERLEAIPWTRFRFDAQKEMEKDGNQARFKYGKIGNLSSGAADQDDESGDEAD